MDIQAVIRDLKEERQRPTTNTCSEVAGRCESREERSWLGAKPGGMILDFEKCAPGALPGA